MHTMSLLLTVIKIELIFHVYFIYFFPFFVLDVKSNRKMLLYLLEKYGIKSNECCDGMEAVNEIKSKLDFYDILFMDNQMPNMVTLFV